MEPYIDVFNRNQNILKMFIKKVLKPLCEDMFQVYARFDIEL